MALYTANVFTGSYLDSQGNFPVFMKKRCKDMKEPNIILIKKKENSHQNCMKSTGLRTFVPQTFAPEQFLPQPKGHAFIRGLLARPIYSATNDSL